MIKSMNFLILILFLFIPFILLPADEQGTEVVKGLLYLDEAPVVIKISHGNIAEIQRQVDDTRIPQMYVAPGLIDIQINGYMGVDFTGPELTLQGIRYAVKALWKAGVTTILPTVITSDHERLMKNFKILAEALTDPEIENSIPGFHLEGPYISPVKGFRGAHLEKYIRLPDWQEFMGYQNAAKGNIKLITVAPEIEGAIPFIRQCVDNGVIVSLGHHNGSAEIISKAADAGATMSTHLGNGCANMINRHHNPIWPQLADERLIPSLIVDGHHLTKEEVKSFYSIKGPDRTVLISDALDLAGLPPGEYVRGERKVVLTPDVIKFPAENVLAGAASPISACVGNMIRFSGCSLNEAIRMASTNPAKIFGLDMIGEISEGKRADLILFTLENDKVVIHKTIIAGEVVYAR